MSNFPIKIDDDTSLPPVNDNLTQIGGEAINAARDAIFNIETELGIGASGTVGSVADRLSVALNLDGTLKSSALTSLGLVTLPITDSQIAENAGIPESKLRLQYRTQDLFNYTKSLVQGINTALGWVTLHGSKLEPHINGTLFKHNLDHIEVSSDGAKYLKNRFNLLRNNDEAYSVLNDLNNEFLEHQFADGSPATSNQPITTNNGSTYTSDYAHIAGGIYLNPNRFSSVPKVITDMQKFAEYIDSASIFLYGSRIQNLYSNGITRSSRSSTLRTDGYGQTLVPFTPVTTYLLNTDNSSAPVDNINTGDDIIEFFPASAALASNSFDEKFALVRVGDIVTVNYGSFEVPFVIKEKKYTQSAGNKKFVVRIAGKNSQYSTNAIARINRPLANNNKHGVLAISSAVSNTNVLVNAPSLIVGSPRGAQILGLGFNADHFDNTHYLLYLALYPTGNPADGYFILPGIDVTGNRGTTPGKYTLESIIATTNSIFRKPGNNLRFMAFSHQGEFGLMLADPYNNSAFSILVAVVGPTGAYDSIGTGVAFQNNVVSVFPSSNRAPIDPLGFGINGAAVASPPFKTAGGYPDGYWGSPEAALKPTKIFVPLKLNNSYVNGVEIERFGLQPNSTQAEDSLGDGYWRAQVTNVNPLSGRVQTTYRVLENLESSDLKIGSTLVVQSLGQGSLADFGRFTVENIAFGCLPDIYTDITVYDAIHATGTSPIPAANRITTGSYVALYFSNDSVSFNLENASDSDPVTSFKRYFEVYMDQLGKVFTHERARINIGGTNITVNNVVLNTSSQLPKINIVKVSPKLRGYNFGSTNKISLAINSFNAGSSVYDGYLTYFDQNNCYHVGPTVKGKVGVPTRFYDETNVDYIDLTFGVDDGTSTFSEELIDIQLFPTLSLQPELMLIGTCQVINNNSTTPINYIKDERQFGNISEKDISDSLFDYIRSPQRLMNVNGIIRGFYLQDVGPNNNNPNQGQLYLAGGVALVNGKLVQVNDQTIIIPAIKELLGATYNVNWLVCVNESGDFDSIPMLDYDAVLGTPLNTSRSFVAFNPVNGSKYNIEGTTFSDLINNRKDLTALYVVASTVTGTTITTANTLALTDVRRFVKDKNWGDSLTIVSSDTDHGDFRDFYSLSSWLNLNSIYNNTVVVKGNFNFLPPTLNFSNLTNFQGDGQATFAINSQFTLTNARFNKLTLEFDDNTFVMNSSYFQDVTLSGSSRFTINSSSVKDSTITTSNGQLILSNSTFDNVVFNLSSAVSFSITNCTLRNCTINCNLLGSTVTFITSANVIPSFINSTVNFNSAGNTLNLLGNVSGNTFNHNAGNNLVQLSGNVRVVNNTFMALPSTLTTQFLSTQNSTNGVISGNSFHRNSNTLASYIKAFSSAPIGVVSILDNYFDSTTIDGSNQNLVQNLPLTWFYANNLNTGFTTRIKRLTASGAYTITSEDHTLAFNLSGNLTVNLPSIALCAPGRTITIKDANGTADTRTITLHRFSINEAIENFYADLVYNNPFGSITLVCSIDPAGGAENSGLTPMYMWSIV